MNVTLFTVRDLLGLLELPDVFKPRIASGAITATMILLKKGSFRTTLSEIRILHF